MAARYRGAPIARAVRPNKRLQKVQIGTSDRYRGPPWGSLFEHIKSECSQRRPDCTADICPCVVQIARSWISSTVGRLESQQDALALTIYDKRKVFDLNDLTKSTLQNLRRSFSRRVNRAAIPNLRLIGYIDFEFRGRKQIRCNPHLHAIAWADAVPTAISKALSAEFRWGNKARVPAHSVPVYDLQGWIDYIVKPIGELKFVRRVQEIRRKSELPSVLRPQILSALKMHSLSDRFLFIGFKRTRTAVKRWYRQ